MERKNHRLFSKALFKQSFKANGIMWGIITAAVCFMLSCVMLISGTSNISSVKDGIQDTIIEELIKSEVKKTSINLYDSTIKGEKKFDESFASKFDELNTKENYNKYKAYENEQTLLTTTKVTNAVTEKVTEKITNAVTEQVQSEASVITQEVTDAVTADMQTTEAQTKIATLMAQGKTQQEAISLVQAEYIELEQVKITNNHINSAKQSIISTKQAQFKEEALNELNDTIETYKTEAYNNVSNKFKEIYVIPSYTYASDSIKSIYEENSSEYKVTMLTINPNHMLDEEYTKNNENIPLEYIEQFSNYMLNDVNNYDNNTKGTSLNEYIFTSERNNDLNNRANNTCSMVIASRMTDDEYKKTILDILAEYKVTEETYDKMGFDYANVHKISYEGINEFVDKLEYEINLLDESVKNDKAKYNEETTKIHDDLYLSVAGSLLDKLPQNVSDGIHELGTMDLYGLIVGSIFFKMAGLLLPIIYVIMSSNSLVAGQVDTGSMAYVLSTSTRREEVTFTQSLYLILSLLLMFVFTTITSCICFKIANVTTDLTYSKLVLINLGAFITLFAISGINFLTSCFFDRSKKAMALGGGISMFFLVATMLGLFGSPVIPSVVRISALNNFNYVSLISLFDVVSILNNGNEWIYKLVILVIIGLLGYVIGAIKFKKKDLPL